MTPEQKAISLSAYLGSVQKAVQQNTCEAWVVAEISSLNINRGSGHAYIDLVEHDEEGKEKAKSRAALWSSQRSSVLERFSRETDGVTLSAGMKVLLRIGSAFHVQHGFSLIIKDIDPSFTLGEMQRKLLKIRADLTAAGVILLNKQRPFPTEFTRVAVVAPAEAAGLGDFRSHANILEDAGLCSFDYVFARFQGPSAPVEIVDAIRSVLIMNRDSGGKRYDAIAIIRGGGSASDLAYLNDFLIANAICRTPIPVFVGIGHERDSVILDEVANYSAHTPSKLIALIFQSIINNGQDGLRHWQNIAAQSERTAKLAVEMIASAVAAVHSESFNKLRIATVQSENEVGFIRASAKGLVDNAKTRVEQALESVRTHSYHSLDVAKRETQHAFAAVIGMGPNQTLKRGFSIVRHEGQAVSRKSEAVEHNNFEIEFFDGKVSVSRS